MNPLDLTSKQLLRLYTKAYNRCERLYAGGCSFGMDARTIKPSWARTITDLAIAYRIKHASEQADKLGLAT